MNSPTQIGTVKHVLGSTVTVSLDPSMAGVAPLYRGEVLGVGQIGSLVRIPQGAVDLVASVTLVGIAELTGPIKPAELIQTGERWLQVQLLGEIDRVSSVFRRGVGSYPALDDLVHFATADDLRCIFPPADSSSVRVGCLAASEALPVSMNLEKFVVRHAAVVGSTGSGKTSAVASILQNIVRGGWRAANIVVIDPHGEYAHALEEHASVRSVLGGGDNKLRVPYWALPSLDVLRVFCGATGGATFANRFSELVTLERRAFVEACDWLEMEASAITCDTPVPFDIKRVWHRLDSENRETRMVKSDPATAQMIEPGDPATLTSAVFAPYAAGGGAPHQSPTFNLYGTMPALLRLGLLDPRLAFFLEPTGDGVDADPLLEVVQEWVGKLRPISVLNFSGVPHVAADLAIGVVLNLLFELSLRSTKGGQGIGRPSPVFIVLEEAHRYLSDTACDMTRASVNKIAREGRKYGIGLLLVTQRPTELPDTALAQCGTIVALRLTNAADQGAIRSALPDNVSGLASVLPSLRTGEAVISGEGVILPLRALLDLPRPMPLAEDPSLKVWRDSPALVNVESAIAAWRGIKTEGLG
ncbi:ATP-binding protein [Luteimonas sp. YGD11-2]|uniref:ATP-binding protein n=1 Tax=Luteimonas sp. YGD11-2 TaxID=2508168 RepID=UPI0019D6CA86|nr:ATP-binding protein [Luteimonas sp. YGD11-2]